MAEGTSENITETIYDPGNVTIHACHLKHGDEVINLVGGLDEFIVTWSIRRIKNGSCCLQHCKCHEDINKSILG